MLGYQIASLVLNNDALLFPVLKNASNPEKELQLLQGRLLHSTIESVGRHGKYFWLRTRPVDSKSTDVLLMHFGMTGNIKIRNIGSHLIFLENAGTKVIDSIKKEKKVSKYFKKEEEDVVTVEQLQNEENESKKEPEEWPPRFTKMELVLEKDGTRLDLAFTDPRRLGRIRLLTGPGIQADEDLLNTSPLDALGPDYSKSPNSLKSEKEFVIGDPDPHHHGRPRPTVEEFSKLVLSKKKPIKSFLLDQAFFSGIGNWVGDEVVYQARIHPNEVISSKIPQNLEKVHPVVQRLYDSIIYICEESVRVEGNVKKFPSNWLMLYRWSKAKKKGPKPTTDDGKALDFVTVGGRTSCFVPELQKPLKNEIGKENNGKAIELKQKPAKKTKEVATSNGKNSGKRSKQEDEDIKKEKAQKSNTNGTPRRSLRNKN